MLQNLLMIFEKIIYYIYIYIGYKLKDFTTADRAQILIYQQGKYLPVPTVTSLQILYLDLFFGGKTFFII